MSLFDEEPITLLRAVTAPSGPLAERSTTYQPVGEHSGHVQALGAESAVRLGLSATVTRYRVRLPPGVLLVPGDRLRFRGREWKAVLVTVYRAYTRVIVEGG